MRGDFFGMGNGGEFWGIGWRGACRGGFEKWDISGHSGTSEVHRKKGERQGAKGAKVKTPRGLFG